MTRYVRDMDIREEGIEIGIEIGLNQGLNKGLNKGDSLRLISLIQKKIQKSKALETIADELEETPDSIRSIYDLIRQHPDKSAEEILECMDCYCC